MNDSVGAKSKMPVGALGFAVATIYVVLNMLATQLSITPRFDFTEDMLFTLSAGTRLTLSRMETPITLHVFISSRLIREVPIFASQARNAHRLINEMVRVSKGKLSVQDHRPEPFSEAEDHALSLGLQGVPIDRYGETVYFGIAAVNDLGEAERIPFLETDREMLLEYDLVKILDSLANPVQKVVGVMSSLPILGNLQAQMGGLPTVPWSIGARLNSRYELFTMPPTVDYLPSSVDTMLVVHPTDLNMRSVYELEQFLFRGGRALIFLDPKADSLLGESPDSISTSTSGLRPLLDHWGISVVPGKLLGDRSLALKVNAGSQSQPIPEDHLIWVGVTPQTMSQTHPAVARLSGVNLASSGVIMREDGSAMFLEPLIESTENSGLIDVSAATGLRPDVLGIQAQFRPDPVTYVMAAQLTGDVTTAFPDGPPAPTVPDDDLNAPHLVRSDGTISVILVADSDMLDDRFWVQKQQFFGREVEREIAGNGQFVMNALGFLVGGDALSELRARANIRRPLERMQHLEQKAQERYQRTETELQERLAEIQSEIDRLEGISARKDDLTGRANVTAFLSDSESVELESLRESILTIRQGLRSVQRQLRQDVERLERWLQFFNIGLAPILICVGGITFGMWIRRRRSI